MIQRSHGREPELSYFIDLVDDETFLGREPLFSQETLKEYNERQEKETRTKLKSYVSHAAEPVKNERDVSSGNNCPVCEGRHDLDNCRQFNDLTLKKQSKTLRKKKLWYGCCSPMTLLNTMQVAAKKKNKESFRFPA